MRRVSSPVVTLDKTPFIGVTQGPVTQYLGIPYAQPPIGNLRFEPPLPIPPYNASDSINAISYGSSCTQQTTPPSSAPPIPANASVSAAFTINTNVQVAQAEDCLFINVVTPANTAPGSKLPVVIWIYGGAFQVGDTSKYNGSTIVAKSITIGEPIVYVSMNYRQVIGSFNAFYSDREVTEREAMRWVQKYINQFGGDPSKVTIWGESAGAISVAMQLVAYDGAHQNLFRAAFMQSGSPLPVGDITDGQHYFDTLVSQTNCSTAFDKLACLKTVPYANLTAAINLSPSAYAYQSLIFPWVPRVDGNFLTQNPQQLVAEGKIANVPFINELQTWIQDIWFPKAPSAAVEKILDLYTDDVTLGSPFNTGTANNLTAQYKRIAAFQGDAWFHAGRRSLLHARSGKQKMWSYVFKRFKTLPYFGSLHSSDNTAMYDLDDDMTNYLIYFVNNLNPNGGSALNWPQYTTSSPNMMTFLNSSSSAPLNITQDNFRQEGITYLQELTGLYPLFTY
ncbi:hypothetical protein HWV62_12440 [Athelia sp. TMB]|nr:hypothetical protein HWV62_12440 [Athelia sp. TMB]